MNARVGSLSVRNLVVQRAGTPVVRSVDMEVLQGNVVALLGANGAGKSSLLDALSGTLPSRGEISIDGRGVQGKRASTRARRGLAYVEQGRTVIGEMTVEQNLHVVAPRRELHRAWEVFPELEPLQQRRAELLSGGQQQMLVLARAILTRPRYLMIDELSLGLAPAIVRRLLPVVRRQAADGVGVLLVEQFADAALEHADLVYVLARGAIAFAGPPRELREDPGMLRRAYLGVGDHISDNSSEG